MFNATGTITFMMPSIPDRPVFVYGTLCKGEERDINRLRPAPCWLGPACVDGVLHDLGDYPGLVLAREPCPGQTQVKGDVYAVAGELEPVLDEIEGVAPQPNGEYEKREVLVFLKPSGLQLDKDGNRPATPLTCLVYEVTPERVAGCPVIEGGDWISFRLARERLEGS